MYSRISATTWIAMNGIMPAKICVQRHVRRRNALQVKRGHRDRRRQERRLQIERDEQPEEQRIDVELGSSGMKIGMKITMISVHSSGQPSRKMMACARIMNCTGVRSSDSTQCSTTSWPPSSANAAEKIAEPTNSQQTIALVLAVR